MNYSGKCILLGIISSLIFFSFMIACMYSTNRSISWNIPYGLSFNYVKLSKTSTIKTMDVIDITTNDNVSIISEYNDCDYIAIYDPLFKFYDSLMLVTSIGNVRYFSHSDYANSAKVGIKVCDIGLPGGISIIDSINTPLVDECISLINSLSLFYKSNINFILNQTSLEHLADTVYIDGNDTVSLENFSKKLTSLGYIITNETTSTKGVKYFISNIFPGSPYEAIVLIASLSLYPIFLFCCIIFLYNKKNILAIHKLHGGRYFDTFFELSKQFLVSNLVCSLFFFILGYYLFSHSLFKNFHLYVILLILCLHLIITFLSFTLGFFINNRTMTLSRVNKNVK